MKVKKSKLDEKIRYQYNPHDRERCGLCTMFRAPDECTDVAGRISPYGWCKIYAPKRGEAKAA